MLKLNIYTCLCTFLKVQDTCCYHVIILMTSLEESRMNVLLFSLRPTWYITQIQMMISDILVTFLCRAVVRQPAQKRKRSQILVPLETLHKVSNNYFRAWFSEFHKYLFYIGNYPNHCNKWKSWASDQKWLYSFAWNDQKCYSVVLLSEINQLPFHCNLRNLNYSQRWSNVRKCHCYLQNIVLTARAILRVVLICDWRVLCEKNLSAMK